MFDYCTCSQDEEHVEDVASDDVADGYVVIVFECSHDGCCQFRQRGSERYDGQTDDRFRHAAITCNRHGALNDHFSSNDQADKPSQNKSHAFPKRERSGFGCCRGIGFSGVKRIEKESSENNQ